MYLDKETDKMNTFVMYMFYLPHVLMITVLVIYAKVKKCRYICGFAIICGNLSKNICFQYINEHR